MQRPRRGAGSCEPGIMMERSRERATAAAGDDTVRPGQTTHCMKDCSLMPLVKGCDIIKASKSMEVKLCAQCPAPSEHA